MKEKISKILKTIGSTLVKPFKGFKNLKKPVKIVLCLVLAVAVALAGFGIYKWRKTKTTSSETSVGTSIVQVGNLTNSITGSGTVEPIEQREIVPEVNGKIIESPFEEGAEVKTGDILYRFEMTAATNAIESAENNVQKAQTTLSNRQSSLTKVYENIEKLTIKATTSGKISDLSLRVGEEASGKICTITNFKEQTATVAFSSAHIGSIRIGDKASVAVDKYMINTSGTVVRKYTAPETLSSGAVVYYVEILLSNDYILEENVKVTATIGNISSASYGTVKYADPVTVNAEQKGKVSKINFKNGDWVDEGEVIAVLKNTDLSDELRTAQQNVREAQMNLTEALNNLEDKQEEANEYIVTSPIDGVILTKDYTVGDTINGQNAPSMMVVADMSKMKFTISADELDIAKIQMGQSVQVTADALEGQLLEGRITAVSKLGTASNGVTNYPIEVTIDDPGELMPGMNVSAEIIVEQAYNALYLPVEAVEYFGGKYYVTVVGEVENMPEMPQMPQMSEGESGGSRAEGEQSEENQTERNNSYGQADGEKQRPQRSEGGFGGQRQEGSGEFGGQRPHNAENGERSQRPQGDKNADAPTNENSASAENERQSKNAGNSDAETKAGAAQKDSTDSAAEVEKGENSRSENREGGGQSGRQRQEMKIKLSGKEERVEVEIGISTGEYYEIKSGVEYGQVVKNTTQTSSSTSTGMMGGMPGGMMGGMMGGMPGGNMGGNMGGNRSGGNRSSNRNSGGNR